MTITDTQVIDTAKRMLKLTQTNEHDAEFEISLKEGFRNLYNVDTYQDLDDYFPLVNGRCEIPKGFYEFIGAAIETGTPILFYNKKYFSTATSTAPIEVITYNWTNTVQIRGNYLEFGSLAADKDEVHLWYKGLPIDSSGNLIIQEECESPLSYYIAWKFCESFNGSDYQKSATYYGGMFDKTSSILRGRLAKKIADERKYEVTSTAIGVLNFYSY